MNPISIRIKPGEIPLTHAYVTSTNGTISRSDLLARAETVQYCLALSGKDYSPHNACELIMRAVIALMTPEGPSNSPGYIVNKLENGLGGLGYYPLDGVRDAPPQSVIPGLYVNGTVSDDAYEYYRDSMTGESIGFIGVLDNLDLLIECLGKTERYACDKVAFNLVKAVRLLVEEHPNDRLAAIELLLWKATQELGWHLDIAPWYQHKLTQGV
ncbi:MAG: hypothetical protein WCV85_02900 [Patescibacteria group bacterium]